MEKTYKRVPFELELTKKIQSGEVEGRIVEVTTKKSTYNRHGCIDIYNHKDAFIELPEEEPQTFHTEFPKGHAVLHGNTIICVKEEEGLKHEFKPFDKVLVKRNGNFGDTLSTWTPAFFQKYVMDDAEQIMYYASGLTWDECIPYKGNEHLVGTTNNPE